MQDQINAYQVRLARQGKAILSPDGLLVPRERHSHVWTHEEVAEALTRARAIGYQEGLRAANLVIAARMTGAMTPHPLSRPSSPSH